MKSQNGCMRETEIQRGSDRQGTVQIQYVQKYTSQRYNKTDTPHPPGFPELESHHLMQFNVIHRTLFFVG